MTQANKTNRLSLVLVTIGIPLLILTLLEMGLRTAGVGADTRNVFVPIPGKESHLALNPEYVKKYFQSFAPAVAFHPFKREKGPETFRVVVLGGSSAAGYPYHFYHSFSEPLRQMIQETMPANEVEVINMAMSAVNSYTLWDLRHAVVHIEPDAVVLYAGHNEYYGAFGAASSINSLSNSIWLKRLSLKLKNLSLYSSLERLLSPQNNATPRQTLMARVAQDRGIELNDQTYQAGLRQFDKNISDVLHAFQKANIPVFAGLLSSNLKDQPPLGETEDANEAFSTGQQIFADGNHEEALRLFLEAKELDGLRFRAPEAINQLLSGMAQQDLCTLIDVPKLARTFSPEGIPDNYFFDDHLHPNAAGHLAIAENIFSQMQSNIASLSIGFTIKASSILDPIEKAYATVQIDILEADYPFNKSNKNPQETIRRIIQQQSAASIYDSLAVLMATQSLPPPSLLREGLIKAKQTNDTTNALSLYRSLLYWQPFNTAFIQEATSFALQQAKPRSVTEEIISFGWSKTRSPEYLDTWAALSIQRGDLEKADQLLAHSERINPNSQVMLFNKARLLVLQGDTASAQTYFSRYQAQQ